LGHLGVVPDSYLLPSAIKACAVLKELKPGRQVLFIDLFFENLVSMQHRHSSN